MNVHLKVYSKKKNSCIFNFFKVKKIFEFLNIRKSVSKNWDLISKLGVYNENITVWR